MPYLALDVEAGGTWRYGLDNQCRVGTSGREPYDCVLHFPLPHDVDATAVDRWLKAAPLPALRARIVAGYTVEWRGGYHVAAYTGDARAAAVELEDLAQDAPRSDGDVHLWGASTWLRHDACDDAVRDRYAITAATSDTRLSTIARRILREAAADSQTLDWPDLLRVLTELGTRPSSNAGNNRQQPVSGALTSRRSPE